MSDTPQLSVVLPVYNETENIVSVAQPTSGSVARLRYFTTITAM